VTTIGSLFFWARQVLGETVLNPGDTREAHFVL
jgi:hypothetical protein